VTAMANYDSMPCVTVTLAELLVTMWLCNYSKQANAKVSAWQPWYI